MTDVPLKPEELCDAKLFTKAAKRLIKRTFNKKYYNFDVRQDGK